MSDDVYTSFQQVIDQLNVEGRIGTRDNYKCSMACLKRFKPRVSFSNITPNFLKSFESFIIESSLSISTVGIYIRPLRAIINTAILDGTFSKEDYPFGRNKYQIPSARNVKKALSLNEIEMILKYKAPEESWFERARDFFLISYVGNGINMKDIALLKFGDIQDMFIHFNRAKTIRTIRDSKVPISIYLTPELKHLITKWQNKDANPANYVFPILSKDMDAAKVHYAIKQFTKMVNKYINIIAKDLKIKKGSLLTLQDIATVPY